MPLVFLAALGFAGVDINWQTGVRLEFRARTTGLADRVTPVLCVRADTRDCVTLDFELQPDARVQFLTRRLNLQLDYAPRIILPNVDSGIIRPNVLHRFNGTLLSSLSRRLTLDISENASYGVTDFSSLIGLTSSFNNAPPTLQSVPLGGLRIGTFTSRTQLGLRGQLTRTLSLSGFVFYSTSGGLTAQDQLSLPLQYGPGGQLDLVSQVARSHALGLRLRSDHSDFSTGQSFTTSELTGRWVWTFRPESSLTSQAGVAVVRAFLPTDAFFTITVAPYARLLYEHRLQTPAGQFILQLSAGLAPFLDRVLAAFYERIELGANVLWRVNDRLQFRLQAQWTFAVFDRNYNGQQLSLADAGMQVRLQRRLSFDAGARFLVSVPGGVAVPSTLQQPQFQWLAFIGLSGNFAGDL